MSVNERLQCIELQLHATVWMILTNTIVRKNPDAEKNILHKSIH